MIFLYYIFKFKVVLVVVVMQVLLIVGLDIGNVKNILYYFNIVYIGIFSYQEKFNIFVSEMFIIIFLIFCIIKMVNF